MGLQTGQPSFLLSARLVKDTVLRTKVDGARRLVPSLHTHNTCIYTCTPSNKYKEVSALKTKQKNRRKMQSTHRNLSDGTDLWGHVSLIRW